MGSKKRQTNAEPQQLVTKSKKSASTSEFLKTSDSALPNKKCISINNKKFTSQKSPKKNLPRLGNGIKQQPIKRLPKEKQKLRHNQSTQKVKLMSLKESPKKATTPPISKEIKKGDSQKADGNSKAKSDSKIAEPKDEKTKAINKMLKHLDIQISGFDNLLSKEERISEDLKSSISENVKTKSRAAAVKVIANLNTPRPKKQRPVEDEKKTQNKTESTSNESNNTNSTSNQKPDSTAETKPESQIKDNDKKANSKKSKIEHSQKNKKSNQQKSKGDRSKEGTAIETPSKRKVTKLKTNKVVESATPKMDQPKKDVAETTAKSPEHAPHTVANESSEKTINNKESSPKKSPNQKKPKVATARDTDASTDNIQKQTDKDELLTVVLDSNTEVVQMELEELPSSSFVQNNKKASSVSTEKSEEPSDGPTHCSASEQSTKNKLKITPISKSKILKPTKKPLLSKEMAQKIKSDRKTVLNNDIYDFKSGSEEEENIKMELPTLKNLHEFSDGEDKSIKNTPTRKEHSEDIDSKIIKQKETKPVDQTKVEEDNLKMPITPTTDESDKLVIDEDPPEENESKTLKKAKYTRKVYKKRTLLPVKKLIKASKAKIIKNSAKKKSKASASPETNADESTGASSDSEDEKKLIIFGQKRHRMASLNALAKVQCLYENESRTAYELGLSKATQLPPKMRTLDCSDDEKTKDEKDKDNHNGGEEKVKIKKELKAEEVHKTLENLKEESEEEPEVSTKRELRNVSGGRGLGKHWEFDSDSENDEIEKAKIKKKKLQKKMQAKKEKDLEKEKHDDKTKDEKDSEKTKEKDASKDKESIKVKRKYTKAKKPLKKLIKLKSVTSDEENSASSDNDDCDLKRLNKIKCSGSKKSSSQKRKRNVKEESLIGDYKGILARKRMASLNAMAIVAATYEVERHLDKNLAYGCSSYESCDETDEKPIVVSSSKKGKDTKGGAKEAKKSNAAADANTTDSTATSSISKDNAKSNVVNHLNEESNDSKDTKETNTDTTTTANFRDSTGSTKDIKESSRPTSSSVVIVQDTDVTITGVYVNSTTGSSQEAYCKMQYRVQSSVTEERVLRPNSVEPPKSYTPLSALSSMLPPGANTATGGVLGEGHPSSPPPSAVVGSIADTLNVTSMYHAAELGLHTEPGAPDHHHHHQSYAAAAAAYHAHHAHQHQYVHTHQQFQQASEHVMHVHAGGPPASHHYVASHYGGPPPPQSRCGDVSPPPAYRANAFAVSQQSPQPPSQGLYTPSPTSVHSTLSMTAGSSASAFCAPSIHTQSQRLQQSEQQQHSGHQSEHESSGYYQPAGPLITSHVLPSIAAPPPPSSANVPLLPPKKQQIPPPLGSDPDNLQPATTSTAETHDTDVLISGGDLTPFRYNSSQASGGASSATTSAHHHQQHLHHHAAAHPGSSYPRSMQMHYSTAYPPNYYSPYPSEAMCYSQPAYQPYFSTKVYQGAYRRYPYYQPGPPHPPLTELYEQPAPPAPQSPPFTRLGQNSESRVPQAGPPPTRPPPAAPTAGATQLVPAGPVAQHLEHYPGPPGYYAGYSPGGGASAQCYSRSLQGPYMDYPTQCPCPMQQSCPKNVHTGPHIGSNSAKMNTTTTTTNTASSSLTNSSNTSSMINSNSCDGSISSSHSKNNKSDAIINGNATYYSNSNSSSNSQSSLNTISESNNGSSIPAGANRGPVKNLNTTRSDTPFQLQYNDTSDIDATTPNQPRLLQEHSMRHCPLDLLQTVKSELKTEDSDSKSQYEDHVVQPLTPPESYTTNDDKLLDPIEKDDGNGLNTILLVDQENMENKLSIENQRRMLQQLDNNQTKSIPMEPYDLTTAPNGVMAKTVSTSLPALIPDAVEGDAQLIVPSGGSNANGTPNNSQQPVSLVGRKARIGKTMAREMVYAGAAVTNAGHQQPPILARKPVQQQNSSSSVMTTLPQESSSTMTVNQLNSHNNNNNIPQVPFASASITSTGKSTQLQASRVPLVLGVEGLEMLSAAANQQTPIKIKSEIKTENIKIEKDAYGGESMLHQQNGLGNVACPETSTVLKSIKTEPLNSSDLEIPNTEDAEVFVMERGAVTNEILDEKVSVPARMRLLPNWQQTSSCLIDLSTVSDDDALDLSSNTYDPDGSNNSKRMKILEFHKNQGKKSSPNSYKNLIKQAVPRSYLCLSRNVDKRGRYGKSQSKLHKSLGGSRNVRRRQLILTEQQKLRLRIRKQKLLDMERMKQEAKELKRAAAKKNRMEQSKNIQTKTWPNGFEDQLLKQRKNAATITGKSGSKLPFQKATSSPQHTVQPKRPLLPALHIVETIDAVARGYFSEPETTRSSVSNSLYTLAEAAELSSSVGRKKTSLTSAEKRSKSETKRPLKIVKKTFGAKAPAKDVKLESNKKEASHNANIAEDKERPTATSVAGKSTTEKKTPCKKLIKTKVLKTQNKKLMDKAPKKDVSGGKKVETAKSKVQLSSKDKPKSTKASKSAKLVDAMSLTQETGLAQETNSKVAEDIDIPKADAIEANNNDFEKPNLLENDKVGSTINSEMLDAQEQQSLRTPQAKQQVQQQQQQHSNAPAFLPPQPVTRIVYQSYHVHTGKRSRSRSKFGCRKRPKLKHSTVTFELDDTLPPARGDVTPKWNNGWTWEGEPFQGAVFLNSDDPLVLRTCYPAMRHVEGDIIRTRDCVLLKANEDNELPYVAKVAHLWENPEDGEMMMSLLWYYRPEHTEQGRQINDSPDEVYASRHRDHNSVACIEDKCYVLTFSEYCRYRRRLRAAEEDIDDVTIVPKRPNYYGNIRTVPDNTNPELVMFCRRAYEFRTKRLPKMKNKHDYIVVTTT